jgi:hypothetical protein
MTEREAFEKWAQGRHLDEVEYLRYRSVWEQAWRACASQASAADEGREPMSRCHLCQKDYPTNDHEGHGLGDCVEICGQNGCANMVDDGHELCGAHEQLNTHLGHVQDFLKQMWATMIDPCDDPPAGTKVDEVCELLLKVARDQREREHTTDAERDTTPPQPAGDGRPFGRCIINTHPGLHHESPQCQGWREATPPQPALNCPKCAQPLKAVKYPYDSPLNYDQWKSQIPGDLFCDCHNNHKGSKPYAYFWKHELRATPPQPAKRYCPEPNTLYKCPYCNRDLRLRHADAVVDSYQNVCHWDCYVREVAPNVTQNTVPSAATPPQEVAAHKWNGPQGHRANCLWVMNQGACSCGWTDYCNKGNRPDPEFKKKAAAPEVTVPAEPTLEQQCAALRKRIHHLEGHNQYFFRCESGWCNPSSDKYGNPSLETLKQLEERADAAERKNATLRERNEELQKALQLVLEELNTGWTSHTGQRIRAMVDYTLAPSAERKPEVKG